uniref:Uncharacterized protein n=1 Tax=Anopheles dirus TaxID=7168 RepID=A0A182NX77_9DIPT
MLLKEMELWGF